MLKVNEIFYSLQGEGADVGLPTIFIRLTGCNLRCKYCDTQYAFYEGEEINEEDIVKKISKWKCKRVCITGGEPLLQDIDKLLNLLLEKNYEVSIETNGSISIEEMAEKEIRIKMDLKLPSSNMHNKMRMENIYLLRPSDELKFVIWNREDYEYAKKIIEKFKPSCHIVMQPVWKELEAKKLAEWILEDEINARLSIQLHKILWGERRGK